MCHFTHVKALCPVTTRLLNLKATVLILSDSAGCSCRVQMLIVIISSWHMWSSSTCSRPRSSHTGVSKLIQMHKVAWSPPPLAVKGCDKPSVCDKMRIWTNCASSVIHTLFNYKEFGFSFKCFTSKDRNKLALKSLFYEKRAKYSKHWGKLVS